MNYIYTILFLKGLYDFRDFRRYQKEIMDKLPKNAQVSKVEFEGPEVVLYTKNPEIITDNGDLIRSLAKELRKESLSDLIKVHY